MLEAVRNIHRLLTKHPLTERHPSQAYGRFLRWQLASRLSGFEMIVPFVDDTHLAVSTGMTGATGNIYTGLLEFEDMSFALHFLNEHDLFGDIGANVGVYSILASGVRRARTIAIEPVPATLRRLRRNIAVNDLGELVEVRAVVAGAERGTLSMSVAHDAMNHVVPSGEGISVPVLPLDEVFDGRKPSLLKIDVEGYETSVVKGGPGVLHDPSLQAMIMELNGSGARYGYDDLALDGEIRGMGFQSMQYDPWTRRLTPTTAPSTHNTIYVRDLAAVELRLKDAKPFRVLGHSI